VTRDADAKLIAEMRNALPLLREVVRAAAWVREAEGEDDEGGAYLIAHRELNNALHALEAAGFTVEP